MEQTNRRPRVQSLYAVGISCAFILWFAIILPLACANDHEYDSVVQVRIMKKRLVRKTFDMVEEISNRENKEVLYAEEM